MLNEKNIKWLKAAGVRAIKTTVQAAIGGHWGSHSIRECKLDAHNVYSHTGRHSVSAYICYRTARS